jgi:hypothetical protein
MWETSLSRDVVEAAAERLKLAGLLEVPTSSNPTSTSAARSRVCANLG